MMQRVFLRISLHFRVLLQIATTFATRNFRGRAQQFFWRFAYRLPRKNGWTRKSRSPQPISRTPANIRACPRLMSIGEKKSEHVAVRTPSVRPPGAACGSGPPHCHIPLSTRYQLRQLVLQNDKLSLKIKYLNGI